MVCVVITLHWLQICTLLLSRLCKLRGLLGDLGHPERRVQHTVEQEIQLQESNSEVKIQRNKTKYQ
jgi:hypothetical protein